MRKIILLLVLMVFFVSADVLRFPALSPDGNSLAFSCQGDIWIYNFGNKSLKRLTVHNAFEGWPVFSPDGRYIAFSSKRYGNFDVFVVPVEGGIPRRLTYHTSDDIVNSWTPDSKFIIFHSSRKNQVSLYKVSIKGGTPARIFPGFWAIPNFAKVSPDGEKIIFNNSWESFRFWWRRGYKGSFNADIILYDFMKKRFEQLTEHLGNDLFPNWSPDGQRVIFVSDRDYRTQNVFELDLRKRKFRRLTNFKKGWVRWLNVAFSKELAVFERNYRLWMLNLKTGDLKPLDFSVASDVKENPEKWQELKRVEVFAVSPDGKKLALISRGDIFVCDKDGKYLRRITDSVWRESEIIWDSDSRHIFFVSDKGGSLNIYRVDAVNPKKWVPIATSRSEEWQIKLSPDGKYLAYVEGKKKLYVYDLKKRESKVIYEGQLAGLWGADFAWSPDSRWIVIGDTFYWEKDPVVINVENGRKIRLFENTMDESYYNWSPDGRFLVFVANYTGHSFPDRTGQYDVYMLPLFRYPEKFKESLYEKLFEKPKKEEKKEANVKIDAKDAEKRKIRITSTLQNESSPVFSPDGKKIAFISSNNDKRELWIVELDELDKVKSTRMIYSAPSLSSLRWLDRKTLIFLSNGKVMKLKEGSKNPVSVRFFYKVKVDRRGEFVQMFNEIWNSLEEFYYDPDFHGANWKRVRETYLPLVRECYTDEEFYFLMNEMFGELNSSHLGIYPPRKKPEEVTAAIGAELEQDPKSGLFVIKKVIKHGPLYKTGKKVEGFYLLAVDGTSVTSKDNLYRLLNGKVGKRLELLVNSKPSKTGALKIFVKPISYSEEKDLLYDEWEELCRERVHKWSKGKIGYVHMKNMGWSELLKFYRNLEKEILHRKALIFDIRFNTGGNVHDQVLNTLIKKIYAKWKIRDFRFTYQPSFAVRPKPMVLLINEFSLSDAEMTANGFKELKLGTIIGNTTYGWLIFTTGKRLINGAYFRIPFWGCYTLTGLDLETSGGVQPHIKVINTFEDRVKGRDPQLRRAVEYLLKKIK